MKKIINLLFRGRIRFLEVLRGEFYRLIINLAGGKCGHNLRVGRKVKFKYGPHAGFVIGDDVYIGDFCIIDCPERAILKMGDRSYLNVGVFVAANESVSIGKATLVAEYTSIRDHDHGTSLAEEVHAQGNVSEPVVIGDDVWVARGVAILKGACIESKAIIGANAVVKGQIPYAGIAVGLPAKVVKYRT